MQFGPPVDEHICSTHCRGTKIIYCKTKILCINLVLLLSVFFQPVHETATYGFHDSRGCVILF